MPRPIVLPFPVPPLALRRRLRRVRRSRLGWWLCATAIGLVAAVQLRAGTEDVARARAGWGTTVAVAVAERDLPAGHRLQPTDLRAERWPAALVPDRAAPTSDELVGRSLRTDVVAGEAVLDVRLAAGGASTVATLLPEGHRAVGIPVHAAPPLEAGDRVDVVDATAGEVVVEAALVVDVDDDRGTVTVAVPEPDAPDLASAATRAPLAITLLAPSGP